MRKIELNKIQELTKKIFEASSEISLVQEELENLLSLIDKNSIEYQKGKISKEMFESNEKRLKKESALRIKKINNLVSGALKFLKMIEKEIRSQKT
ncbi:MAG: hypothetical protein QXP77_00215 [Candidatus Aenigmatarchaeota archaeon]